MRSLKQNCRAECLQVTLWDFDNGTKLILTRKTTFHGVYADFLELAVRILPW